MRKEVLKKEKVKMNNELYDMMETSFYLSKVYASEFLNHDISETDELEKGFIRNFIALRTCIKLLKYDNDRKVCDIVSSEEYACCFELYKQLGY